jgi:hypothetical protein
VPSNTADPIRKRRPFSATSGSPATTTLRRSSDGATVSRPLSAAIAGRCSAGREELRKVYEEVIGAFVRIESYKSFVKGDAGWDWVNFHVSFPPEANIDPFTFKMLFLWERIDGEWWSQGEMYVPGEFDISS